LCSDDDNNASENKVLLASSGEEQLPATDKGQSSMSWAAIPGRRWSGVIFAVIFYLYDLFVRLLPSEITTTLQAEFNLNASQVTSGFGSSVFLAYACTQLLHGILLDVFGARMHLTASALVAMLGNLLFAFAPADSAGLAVAGRFLSGLGIGGAFLGLFKVLTLTFNPKQQGIMLGISVAIGYSGGLLVNAPFRAVVTALGWRHAVAATTIIPVSCMAGFCVCLVDSPLHSAASSEGSNRTSPRASLREAFARTTKELFVVLHSRKLYMFAVCAGGVDTPFETLAGLWGVAFFEQAQDMTANEASFLVSLFVVMTTCCITLAGLANNRIPSHHARAKVMTVCIGVGLIGLLPFVTQGAVPYGVLVLGLALVSIGQASITLGWLWLAEEGLLSGVATALVPPTPSPSASQQQGQPWWVSS
jgi:MFS family permease